MTSAVSNMSGHRRDYNAVMSIVQAAHETTLRLSALITPTVAVNCGVSAVACLLSYVRGVLPRPECRVLAPTPPLGCTDTVAADINLLLPLYAAAVTSAAVDDLMAAVGELMYLPRFSFISPSSFPHFWMIFGQTKRQVRVRQR